MRGLQNSEFPRYNPFMRTLVSVVGPSPAAVVHHYASRQADIALLHTAAERGRTVFAMHPIHTYEALAVDPSDPPASGSCAALRGFQAALTEHLELLPELPDIGWIVQLSYDLAYHLECITGSDLVRRHAGAHAQDDLRWPLIRATLYGRYAVHDAVTGNWSLYALSDSDDPDAWAREIAAIAPDVQTECSFGKAEIIPPSQQDFEAGVGRVLQYIATGDIYQANLTHRWQARNISNPEQIYARLAQHNPAEFAAYLQWRGIDGSRSAVVSASPELFLRRNKDLLETRPMKGTRPRGKNREQDEVLRQDLLHSEKDKAELAMIVDLLRNDLGRVSEFGTVKVSRPRTMEMHPTVWHTTATVESVIRADLRDNWAALLAAVIPGGSITGAPKIRACQIIDELEPHRRGLYCGNIGIINPAAHSASLSIAIRTILMQRPAKSDEWTAHISAGAGIVSDSVPGDEYAETCAKAAALLRSL